MRKFLLVLLLSAALAASSEAGTYLRSAHGNTTYGVNRTSMGGYSRGNCDHCHEMHASQNGTEPVPQNGQPSPFALFAPNFNTNAITKPYQISDDFCFYCHTGSGSLQSGGSIKNYTYSKTFGGYTNSTIVGIFSLFNGTGYSAPKTNATNHNLYDVYNFAKNAFPSFFTDYSNPCVACHNPHLARANKRHVDNPNFTAISRPTAHFSLWGDTPNETMLAYTQTHGGIYQAPYYYNQIGTAYEPANDSTYNGSNMPDYVSYCTDCHNTVNDIYSNTIWHLTINGAANYSYSQGGYLRKIDWSSTGDKHGLAVADSSVATSNPANLRKPYNGSPLVTNGTYVGFVLSCTDCHEPHGSPGVFLLRDEVNGLYNGTFAIGTTGYNGSGVINNGTLAFSKLCSKCHTDDSFYGGTEGRWQYVHHINPDAPYTGSCYWQCGTCHFADNNSVFQIDCQLCHFHGSDDSWLLYTSKSACYTGRRTF